MSNVSVVIVNRFFFALRLLIQTKKIRGVQTFTNAYGIDRRNFLYVEKNPSSKQFEVEWLCYICRDYNVSADWLLLGKGEMIKSEE